MCVCRSEWCVLNAGATVASGTSVAFASQFCTMRARASIRMFTAFEAYGKSWVGVSSERTPRVRSSIAAYVTRAFGALSLVSLPRPSNVSLSSIAQLLAKRLDTTRTRRRT